MVLSEENTVFLVTVVTIPYLRLRTAAKTVTKVSPFHHHGYLYDIHRLFRSATIGTQRRDSIHGSEIVFDHRFVESPWYESRFWSGDTIMLVEEWRPVDRPHRPCRSTWFSINQCDPSGIQGAKMPRDVVRLGPFQSESPLRIGSQRQLLVDTHLLADWWNVRQVQEKVRKHPENPIVEADQAWENAAREGYGVYPTSAIYDEQDSLYKMWYYLPWSAGGSVSGYATSMDGIKWQKPSLGLIDIDGTTTNNVCVLQPFGEPLRGLQVINDPRTRSGPRRFEAVGINPYHEDGTYYGGWGGSAHSEDGTTWQYISGGTRAGAGGGNPSAVWDETIGKYVMFHRQIIERAMPQRLATSIGRYIVRQESDDLAGWSPRQTVFNPMDERWPEVESMMVIRHEGIYFGFPQMLENEIRGEVEIHLLTSRDGYTWDRPFPNQAFVPLGPRGDFDDFITWFGLPVIHGDEVKIYYGGAQYPHSKPVAHLIDAPDLSREAHRNAIGLATVKRDRFIGLRADEPWGAFLTRPILIEDDDLYVNAAVDRELRIEVVDTVGEFVDIGQKAHIGHYVAGEEHVYEGYSMDDCELVSGDSVRHRVRWAGGKLGRFKGQAVRLRFAGRMATTYAFWVE